jgi:membrane protein implicated in regulation of membrane protease activity
MNWIFWIILMFALIVLEMTTPATFYFLSLALGCLVAAIFAYIGMQEFAQYTVFAIISLMSIFIIRPIFAKIVKNMQGIKTNVDALIDREAIVSEKITPLKSGFIKIDGDIWLAESDYEIEAGEIVIIKFIKGTKAVVIKK